jgi:hypothetical protein
MVHIKRMTCVQPLNLSQYHLKIARFERKNHGRTRHRKNRV